ncbi:MULTISPECIES: N-6 DNA methylase [Paenibacillus]|uniref:N-6 DNA methylase n=1 Tax=Paenibacillus TaxID=44249 RepID=UPI002351F245|nr:MULTISPECIES: N-6 DNA methylase [Paenibacillus]
MTPHEVSQVLAKIVTDGVEESDKIFSVYDPTYGSGPLLLMVQGELSGGDKPGAIKFLGQEKNTTTHNLARMNLIMHGVSFNNMTLSNADTLESDWPDGVTLHGNMCELVGFCVRWLKPLIYTGFNHIRFALTMNRSPKN